ncbi:MAG TPA: sigma-70 family RNA polymerase sigma factor [Solirubrobacterales bacterium]
MTDAELVLRARGGDQIAAQRLVRRHRGLAKIHALDYFAPGLERDDLIAEGLLGLAKAIRDYRPDRDSGFRNFADICVKRQVITAIKTANRTKHKPLNHFASFSQPLSSDSDTTLEEILAGPLNRDPAAMLENAQESAGAASGLAVGLSRCTLVERESIKAVYERGESYDEVGARFGVSPKTIDNAIVRGKRKLAESLQVAAA